MDVPLIRTVIVAFPGFIPFIFVSSSLFSRTFATDGLLLVHIILRSLTLAFFGVMTLSSSIVRPTVTVFFPLMAIFLALTAAIAGMADVTIIANTNNPAISFFFIAIFLLPFFYFQLKISRAS